MRSRPDSTARTTAPPEDYGYPAAGGEVFDPSLLTQLLLFRWRLIAAAVAVALAGAGIYLWRAPRVYAARATVQVEGEPRRVTNFDEVNTEDLRTSEALKTLEAVLTARPLLRRVVEVCDLAHRSSFVEQKPGSPPWTTDQLVDVLAGRVSVGLRRGTRLIDIAIEDRDPALAQQLAERLLGEFALQRLGEDTSVSQTAQQLLTRQAEELKARLEQTERELQSYREQTHAVSLEEGQNIIAGKLRELSSKVTEAKSRRVELESAISQVRAIHSTTIGNRLHTPAEITAALLEVPAISATAEVADLRRQLHERDAELAVIEKRYLYKHPKNIWLKNQIAQLRNALDGAVAKAAEVLENTFRGARETEVAMEKALREQETAALELTRIAGPYQVLQRQLQSDRTLYDSILTRLKQTDVLAGVQPGMAKTGFRVIEPPLASSRPVKPSRYRTLALALAAGLALGIAGAVMRELFNASFRTVDDAENELKLPGLAAVPQTRRRRREHGKPADARDLPMIYAPDSFQAEAFRSFRASLALLDEADGKSVLFTSAVPGEGKTYCAANYAVSLAQQGLITLFVSGDLRRPRADKLLGRQEPPADNVISAGLTDCLEGRVPLAQAVRTTDVPNLFLLPAGRRVANPSNLLLDDAFPNMLAAALKVFDRVVVDTPPIQAVSDGLLIAQHVGAVCLVVRAETTPRRVIKRARALLDRAGIDPVGFIFNRVSVGAGARYRYYLYGDKYSSDPEPAVATSA